MTTGDTCFGVWRLMSQLCSNTMRAESQLVLKGHNSSGGAELLQDLPHTPCLCLATWHISSWIIYILLFFIPCNTSFLSLLIPVSTALQWNLSFFYSPKKCNRKRLESGQQKWHTERQNNSCGDCVKADIRTIFIPFLLTESPASGLVFFAFTLGKNYHLKEQCLLAHFKIPSYWQARIEMS